MNGLLLTGQRQRVEWPDMNPTIPLESLEQAAPAADNPFARLYAVEEGLPSTPSVPIIVQKMPLGACQAEIPPAPHRKPARLVSARTVRRVPYIDRSREMRWIRGHQAEYADQWVALDRDRVIAAGFDAKAVFAAARAASVGRPLFVHMEPKHTLPFGGW